MKNRSKPFFTLLLALTLLAFLAQCKGGEKCGPGMDPLTDMDSDCVANDADNCPLYYNPSQADGDEDGVGYDCDLDDADETVGPVEALMFRADPRIFFINDSCYFVVNNEEIDDPISEELGTFSSDVTVTCALVLCDELKNRSIDISVCNND